MSTRAQKACSEIVHDVLSRKVHLSKHPPGVVVEVTHVEVLNAMFVSSTMEEDGDTYGSLVLTGIFIHPFINSVIKIVHAQFSIQFFP